MAESMDYGFSNSSESNLYRNSRDFRVHGIDDVEEDPIYSEYGDDEDIGDLVDEFVMNLPDRIAALQQAHISNDRDNVRRSAHQLRGSAGGYGFPEITDAAARLEHAVQQGEATVDFHVLQVIKLCRRARSRPLNS